MRAHERRYNAVPLRRRHRRGHQVAPVEQRDRHVLLSSGDAIPPRSDRTLRPRARGDVLKLVVFEGLRVAIVGIVIGGAIALTAGRWLGPLLFDESPRDPAVYSVVALTLLTVSLAASLLPARRASLVEPTRALRYE